jgi:hypothetical protein
VIGVEETQLYDLGRSIRSMNPYSPTIQGYGEKNPNRTLATTLNQMGRLMVEWGSSLEISRSSMFVCLFLNDLGHGMTPPHKPQRYQSTIQGWLRRRGSKPQKYRVQSTLCLYMLLVSLIRRCNLKVSSDTPGRLVLRWDEQTLIKV